MCVGVHVGEGWRARIRLTLCDELFDVKDGLSAQHVLNQEQTAMLATTAEIVQRLLARGRDAAAPSAFANDGTDARRALNTRARAPATHSLTQ